MKHTRRGRTLTAALLALALCLGLLSLTALAAENVDYIYYEWNETTQTLSEPKSGNVTSATEVTTNTTTWNSGWYVAQGEVTISSRVTVTGDVHLILADNCTLTVNGGINVAESNSLTIYGQTQGTGTLVAQNCTSGCAGIGGASGAAGGTVTIHGGNVTATGGSNAAGIGGGYNGAGGTVNISGGTVTATGGNNGAGIGKGFGSSVDDGTFSTGENGHAVIFASGDNSDISDQSGKTNGSWSGVIFEETTGAVYGNPTPKEDFTIPTGNTLIIPTGTTLTIPEDVTVTNQGTVTVEGTLTNSGTILLEGGTFSGKVTGNQPCYPTSVSVSFSQDGQSVSPVPYGSTVTITANVTGGSSPVNDGTVTFYRGEVNDNNKLNSEPANVTSGTATASIQLTGNDWTPSETPYTITAVYTPAEGSKLLESTGSTTLMVNKATQTAPSAPSGASAVTANSITLNTVTGGSGQGEVQYGYTTDGSSSESIDNWQDGTTFNNLTAATAYTFYARYAGNENYEPSDPSAGTPIYTAHAAPKEGEGYTIDYEAETITVNSGYEVNTAANFNGTAIQSGASLSDYTGQTLYIRHTGTQGGAPASAAVVLTIPARPAAPTGITGGNNQISGLTDEMEYSTDGESWTEVNAADLSNGVLSNLEAGEYQVRFAATDSAFVSESAAVTVNDLYIPPNPSYVISVNQAQGGKITANPTAAKKGDTVTLTVTPEDGYQLADLTVTDFWGKDVALTKQADGTYTFTMPGSQVEIEASFTQAGEPEPELPFTDVTEADWFYDEVQYVVDNGLMIGTSDTTFDPNGTTTRAMVWTILARMDGETITGSTWVEDARAWAMENEVSDGTGADDAVTREQLVTMLWRYVGQHEGTGDLSGFADADTVSGWAEEAMRWSVGTGLIVGDENGLTPTATAIRAQIAAILMRFCENVAK